MAITVLDIDGRKARRIVEATGLYGIHNLIAEAIAIERERCAQIAESIDSGRGNEAGIAAAIRRGEP